MTSEHTLANELVEGEPRIGFVFDGLPDTPHVAGMLTKSAGAIELRLPWHTDYNRLHERWFMAGAHWGDDPDKTKYRYAVPRYLDFHDPGGEVALVGCAAAGFTSNLWQGGTGTVHADFAVLGASDAASFAKVNGVRSEIEGLGTWMGLRSLSHDYDRDDEGRVTSALLKLRAPDPIRIARTLNLEVRPAYRAGPGDRPDETVIQERMFVQSLVRSPRDWWAHLDLHFAIRDLLRVVAWRPLNFVGHEASRDDDPVNSDGTSRGRGWKKVETVITGCASKPAKLNSLDMLFSHQDLGPGGMRSWITEHTSRPRVVHPIVRLLELNDASLETHIAQLGIGLEALGYELALGARVRPRTAGQEQFRPRLTRILDALSFEFPFDHEETTEAISEAYNSVKHANRAMPTGEALVKAYLLGIQLFRAWVMTSVGVRPATALKALDRDRLTRRLNAL